jgi:hypothetical protein
MFNPIDTQSMNAVHHDRTRRLSRHRATDERSSRPRRTRRDGDSY